MATRAVVTKKTQPEASTNISDVDLQTKAHWDTSDDERRIIDWCHTNIGTARDIRHECGLQHLKVKDVLEMCERLTKAGHVRGRDLPPGWRPFGQYSLLKQLVMKRDAIG